MERNGIGGRPLYQGSCYPLLLTAIKSLTHGMAEGNHPLPSRESHEGVKTGYLIVIASANIT
jgi:hypothetical protein